MIDRNRFLRVCASFDLRLIEDSSPISLFLLTVRNVGSRQLKVLDDVTHRGLIP